MGDESLKTAILSIAWISFAISMSLVFTRIYIRCNLVKRITVDDYIVLFTLFLSFGNSVFLTISTSYGLGQHIQILQSTPQRIPQTIKYVYLCEVFAIMCPCFGRIAFALMLLSLLPHQQIRRRILQAIIIIAFVVDLGTVSISFAQCKPIEAFWDGRPGARCWPKSIQQTVGFIQGSIGSLIDLTLALFPASLFWKLKMGWKQKAALSSIMGLGIFAMIASIVKTVNLRALTATFDLTYEMGILAIWWTLEANFVLIAVTIPTLRPIMKNKKAASSHRGGTGEQGIHNAWEASQGQASGTKKRSFIPLQESSTENIVASHEDSRPVLEAYQLSSIQSGINHDHDQLGSNIRRDIVVSVTYSPRANAPNPHLK